MNLCFEEEKSIFDLLKKYNVCLRCCFRFIGCRSHDSYENPFESAKRLGYIINVPEDSWNEPACAACLGILQNDVQETLLRKIRAKVEREGYDCSTFTCALTIPVCTWLRERLLLIHCSNELSLSHDILTSLKLKVQNIKDVLKWRIIPKLEETIKKRADLIGPSPFLIEAFLLYDNDDKECEKVQTTINANNKQKRKRNENKISRKGVEVLLSEISDEKFSTCYTSQVLETIAQINVGDVLCSHTSVFVGGRYNKLSRQLSQTPWFINGEKKMETSVQDLLCAPIAFTAKAETIKFLSSGREDVDVRNIYSGRPFAVELVNPRMTNITESILSDLVTQVNKSSDQVQIVSKLKVLSRNDLKLLKEGENVKTKFYRALCVCRNGSRETIDLERLNKLKRVKIIQKTPIRVLHRRPLSPRCRYVYEMRARWTKPEEVEKLLRTVTETADQFFVIDVKTQAGTYVKEFVHGDFGRTKPSLCDLLGIEVDIVALDVTGINLNWP